MGIGALYVDRQLLASSLALLVRWRPSGNSPDVTTPAFLSTDAILLFAPGFSSLEEMIFSQARTTPCFVRMPIHVPPFSTAFTAYSTWKLRPSGEKTELDKSYPVPMEVWLLLVELHLRTVFSYHGVRESSAQGVSPQTRARVVMLEG